jgi:hypothetical protein
LNAINRLVVTLFCLLLTNAFAQSKPPTITLIKAGRLIDVRAGRVLDNQGISLKAIA